MYATIADCILDALLERNARVLQLPAAIERNRTSLSNWVEFTGSICEKETSFLNQQDLCAITKSEDDGVTTIEQVMERLVVWILNCFGKVGSSSHSVFAHEPSLSQR